MKTPEDIAEEVLEADGDSIDFVYTSAVFRMIEKAIEIDRAQRG